MIKYKISIQLQHLPGTSLNAVYRKGREKEKKKKEKKEFKKQTNKLKLWVFLFVCLFSLSSNNVFSMEILLNLFKV